MNMFTLTLFTPCFYQHFINMCGKGTRNTSILSYLPTVRKILAHPTALLYKDDSKSKLCKTLNHPILTKKFKF